MNVSNKISWEEAVLWYCNQHGNAQAVLDNYFDENVVVAAKRFSKSKEFIETLSLLPTKSNSKLLEIGAGRGIASFAFYVNGYSVTAMEPDPSTFVGAGAIRSLNRETGAKITVIEDIGEKLPFKDAIFDVVYVRQALHHARDLQKFLAEIARVLVKDGFFLATREHVIDQERDLQAFLDSHPLHHLYGGENAYPLKQYLNAINSAGLKIIKVLAPFDSDINLFPTSRREILNKFSQRHGFNLPGFLQQILFEYYNRTTHAPGRLYSFLASKKSVGVMLMSHSNH